MNSHERQRTFNIGLGFIQEAVADVLREAGENRLNTAEVGEGIADLSSYGRGLYLLCNGALRSMQANDEVVDEKINRNHRWRLAD